jgi:hypothetical protein
MAVSERQLAANRRNAKKGGVKTAEGKALIRLNALKHGLLSQEVLLAGESEETLIELEERLVAELQPQGELERILVDRIVSSTWRLRRAIRVETNYIQAEFDDCSSMSWGRKPNEEAKAWNMLVVRELGNSNTWLNLNRYEAAIERQIYKALHELIGLQMARRGEKPLAPVAIDVVDVEVSQGD